MVLLPCELVGRSHKKHSYGMDLETCQKTVGQSGKDRKVKIVMKSIPKSSDLAKLKGQGARREYTSSEKLKDNRRLIKSFLNLCVVLRFVLQIKIQILMNF